jgi:hypothetical protein
VVPNDNIWVKVDGLMTHDVCGPGTFGIFKKEFGDGAKVRCTSSAPAPNGHCAPACGESTSKEEKVVVIIMAV